MTYDDVAAFLAQHPDFFDRYPQVLANIAIPHPQNGQAISLVERQTAMLRERIKSLESRLTELVRHGAENDATADRLVRWARTLLAQPDPAQLPATVLDGLRQQFTVPFGALRLWRVAPAYAGLPWATPVSDDMIRLAGSMHAPFCGANVGFEVAGWMADDPDSVKSLAMMPLRDVADEQVFGMLALGSPDAERFHITMGTAFLLRIAELAGAALRRLRG